MDPRARFRDHPDAVLGLLVVLGYAVEVAARGDLALLALVPAVAAAVGLRRRAPLVALALCLGLWTASDVLDAAFNEEGGLTWLVTWLVVHYALGRWTSGPAARVAPAAAAGAAVALGWGDITRDGLSSADLAYFLTLSLVPWGLGLFVRLRQRHLAELRAENERLEREQVEAARRAVAEERARIARELHDVVSHAIAVTVLQSRGARRRLGTDEAAVREALDAIEQTNAAALSDMRRLLAVLRETDEVDAGPDGHAPQPSLARIGELVEEVRASGLSVDLSLDGSAAEVPPGVDLSAYRIVQEALTNVLKHAGRQATAAVRLVFGPHDLHVTVRNTGAADGAGDPGHGLLGIRERVAIVGGEVTAGPLPGGGFEVSARLPYALEVV